MARPIRHRDTFADVVLGPRVVGGRYLSGYWGTEYTVLAIDLAGHLAGHLGMSAPSITVLGDDGVTRSHCTAWDPRRDKVMSTPPICLLGTAV